MPSKHELNALEIAKIKYKFQISKFDYTLPAQGVDLEFLSLRRNEVLDHLETLKVKVSTIDFTTLPGVDEFHIADSMVTWYQLALREINQKEYMLGLKGKYNSRDFEVIRGMYMDKAIKERAL